MRRSVVSWLHLGLSCGPACWPTLLIVAAAVFLAQSGSARAEDSPELIQPPICSAATVGKDPRLEGICEVTPLPKGGNRVKINLTANTGPIDVGGYTVVTEHYNRSYLTPVVEAMPGDTVAAHLVNWLAPRTHEPMVHGDGDKNPTNLHYFHGGIVTPRNSRKLGDASGNPTNLGDNVYVHLKAAGDLQNANGVNFEVPIPGEGELDARVLESEGNSVSIAHPFGLNWYHSHLHGISSDQVMGGMSGLLSVGGAKENVKAACIQAKFPASGCENDVKKDTVYLKDYTDVRYVLLRDISLRNVSTPPENANGATAEWAPQERDFTPEPGPNPRVCPVWKEDGSRSDDAKLRRGFCQRDQNSAWLFTLNGQRFPTITVEGGRNLVLRMGNVSANVAYWLELYNARDERNKRKLTVLSLDGVVPAKPVDPAHADKPIEAFAVPDLLLMPASRAEVYIRNDGGSESGENTAHPDTQVYILRTKGVNAGTSDWWPEVQLARIVLKPNPKRSPVVVAINAPVERRRLIAMGGVFPAVVPRQPKGCADDIDRAKGEHRRVYFLPGGKTSDGRRTQWSMAAQIVQPPPGSPPLNREGWLEEEFLPAQPVEDKAVGEISNGELVGGIPFEEYELPDGSIDWQGKKHVCIRLQPGGSSHKQLWVLDNIATGALHNFHIHQIKFRLATASELINDHKIDPQEPSHTCPDPPEGSSGEPPACGEADQDFYIDDRKPRRVDLDTKLAWHDTIPVPPGKKVYVIMSFDDQRQVGRFVFHCHILKHEDRGLMAPIEVWDPSDAPVE